MNSLKNIIFSSLNECTEENTIYVLKGFNYWIDSLDLQEDDFLFSREVILKNKPNLNGLTQKLSDRKKLYCLYEDILWLSYNSLGGLIGLHDYKIKVIENDLFTTYFPNKIHDVSKSELQDMYISDSDNIAQVYYGDVTLLGNQLYIAYNDITTIDQEVIKLTDLFGRVQVSGNTNDIEMPEESDNVTFASNVLKIIEEDVTNISILEETIEKDRNISKLIKVLKPIGINFKHRNYQTKTKDFDSVILEEYKSILKRKNNNYDFFNINIYEDPYESTELSSVNQSAIVNDIVTNVLPAQKNESLRDVFVTAPSGAGKSVMFQIPAIYLAEKYDLVTIVISPLIGLMNDQVANIQSMTDKAATINSDYTPMERDETLNAVKEGKKSILYLSPESLLSNTDITNLIGDRKIGLVVVDEAHIVATWGKSFRPDYWYLGEFIHRLRSDAKSNHRFPIATFTATATFGGDDNMYQEIIESLKMTSIKYIGNVKREDIFFDIRKHQKEKAYREEKLSIAAKSINDLQKTNDKALVYVPYTKHVTEILAKIETPEKVGKYYGGMQPGEKNETLKAIKDNTKNVVIATKAFGMGIDIDDIKYVYHFAPTGNIADYVQEIGRVARKKDMSGVAITDFYKEDFRYVNQLYGMSSIKNYQVKAVLQKIHELYIKHNKRNFLVAPEEFSYIFADTLNQDDIDGKLKTTLLIIKKDFEQDPSLNYVPLIFKPRSMFTYGYFLIHDDYIDVLRTNGVFKYFEKLNLPGVTESLDNKGVLVTTRSPGDTYCLDFKSLWENKYKDMSFGSFKYHFYKKELSGFNFDVGVNLHTRIIIEIDSEKLKFYEVKSQFNDFLSSLKSIFDDLRHEGKHFSNEDLSKRLLEKSLVQKKYIADLLASTITYLLGKIELNGFNYRNFFEYNSVTNKYVLMNTTYEQRINVLRRTARNMLANDADNTAVRYTNRLKDNKEIVVSQILEILELANCKISSGRNPEFFIRINNPYAIEKIVRNSNYRSRTVSLVADKHHESCRLMEYFFTELNTDDERWNFIEKYFLGRIDE